MRRRFMSNKGTNNIIRYKSADGKIVEPYNVDFGAVLLSNTYSDIGIILFNDEIKYFGDFVFQNCSSLTSIEIPNSITSIGIRTFRRCTGLTNIQIPDSVTSIEEYAFGDCTSLTNAVIGNSVISIGNSVFSGCTSLASVVIGNSVISIGNSVFSDCDGLTSIQIPNSVTSIRENAFNGCNNLISVYVKATTPPTLGSGAFDYNASNRKIYVPRASLNAYKTASGWSNYASAIEPYDFD